MVQSNKILTVSYGTFSCTLEGFDDAFGTMKAIAEYFRDLAAEDRYFGAEPPQPDADMLAHIAQKEIARRVEAHEDKGGIVLRAEDPTVAAPVVAAATEALVASAPDADPTEDAYQDATPEDTAGVDARADADVDGENAPEIEDVSAAVTAELASADAVPSSAEDIPQDDASPVVADAVVDATPTDVMATQVDDVIAEVAQDDADIDAAPLDDGDDTQAAAEAFFAGAQDPAPEPEPTVEDTVAPIPATTLAAESIAAKLQRIRAVVSKGTADPSEQDFSEDEHADPIDTPAETADAQANISALLGGTEDDATDAHAPVDEVEDNAPVAEMDIEDDESEIDEDAFLETLNDRLDALDPAGGVQMQTPGKVDERFEEDLEDAAAEAAKASAISSFDHEPMAAVEEDLYEEEAPETPLDSADVAPETLDQMPDVLDDTLDDIVDDATDVMDDAADTPEDVPASPPQARVLKVSKQEFEAILAADRGEELPTVDMSADDSLDDDFESSLSPEEEEDLLRELAAVEADTDDELDDDEVASIFADAEAEAEAEADAAAEDSGPILTSDVDSDANVSRLLEEADGKLNEPETNNRRSEFAHLRAAMAAGKAEEAAGKSMSEAASDDAYRDDLARVVKPRRPASADTRERSRRPQDEKPAPLKLVAAQRIDAEPATVKPRRVMSTPVEDRQADGADGKMKFADYAEGVGAENLPDLLEAAAAYLSFVEGQEQFSRPQLMTKVRMVESQEFSREDGLRSFGVLLRDGKIEKTQAGRFTVSDRIGFRPEDMRAAG